MHSSIPENPGPVIPGCFEQDCDPEILAMYGREEWAGPKAYAADDQLGAWTYWTPELGIVVTVDTAGTTMMHTVDELQAFHAAIGGLLAKLDARNVQD
ncbi:hypothetical protein E8P82_14735 [Arthrobacter echini]|uniref:Uncharacterized protein n=1 Tax=Arthrobacter echini TaxID=1529066 RepID=A0A4S5E013_9MICC|nr:hypothetical protein [Arthrobacter echini]THJ64590.1 hypothetical protein E8P82_14735 [Arthrobacter echini]